MQPEGRRGVARGEEAGGGKVLHFDPPLRRARQTVGTHALTTSIPPERRVYPPRGFSFSTCGLCLRATPEEPRHEEEKRHDGAHQRRPEELRSRFLLPFHGLRVRWRERRLERGCPQETGREELEVVTRRGEPRLAVDERQGDSLLPHEPEAMGRQEERRTDEGNGCVVAVIDRDEELAPLACVKVEQENGGLPVGIGVLPRSRGDFGEGAGGLGTPSEPLPQDSDPSAEDPRRRLQLESQRRKPLERQLDAVEREAARLPGTAAPAGVFGPLRRRKLQHERLVQGLQQVGHLPAVCRRDPDVGQRGTHGQDRGVEAESGQAGRAGRDRPRDAETGELECRPQRDASSRQDRGRGNRRGLPVAPARVRRGGAFAPRDGRARGLEIVSGGGQPGRPEPRRQRRPVGALEVDPGKPLEDGSERGDFEGRIPRVVDDELQLGLGRRYGEPDRHRGGCSVGPLRPAKRRRPEFEWDEPATCEAGFEDARAPEDVARGDADLDRRDGQARGAGLETDAGFPGLAGPALERDRFPERLRRGAGSGEARLDAWRKGHAPAPGVVPDEAQETVIALRETGLGPGQPFLGKVEESAFGHEDRPARPVTASLEAEALEVWRGETREANAVDPSERAEVGFEAARALRLRDREQRRAHPLRFAGGRRHQEVRHLTPVLAEEAQVAQEAGLAARLGTREERPVDAEAVRPGCRGRHRPRVPEGGLGGADTLFCRRGKRDGEEREGNETAHRRHSLSLAARTNFCSATATRAREIARPTKEATR